MNIIVYIIIGFIIGVGLVLVFSCWARLSARQAGEKIVGICRVAFGRSAQKLENKNKILELLKEKGEMSNSEIRDALNVSPKTAVNYLDELEREDKVEQVGEIGQSVHYRLL